jgi:general secretion pathway protein D
LLGLGGFGIPQIQYENVGLNIDMTPQVYDDDVQMKMKIESSSIDGSTSTLTPTFNQRTMSSMARIRDGQTTMIAGISQTTESKEVKGVPLIGLIPILGRFFATPNTTNKQSDVVMTVTPHILRRADIHEEDHLAREVGPEQNPRKQVTLEQILYLADQEAAQMNPTAGGGGAGPSKLAGSPTYQNPAGNPATPGVASQTVTNPVTGVVMIATSLQPQPVTVPTMATSGDTGARPRTNTPPVTGVAGVAAKKQPDDDDDDDDATPPPTKNQGPISVTVRPSSPMATKGQQFIVIIIINGDAEISSATLSLTYDPNILEIKAVRDGGLMRSGGASSEPQFNAQAGMLTVQMDRPAGFGGAPAHGQLLFIVFDVKGQGQTTLGLTEQTSFRSPTGQAIPVRLQSAQVEAK